jgi:hypothetical protein
VAYSGPNGTTAQLAMQEVVGLLEHDTAAHPTAAVRFETINPPTPPHRLNSQAHAVPIALGCAVGLMGSGLVVWGRRRLRT